MSQRRNRQGQEKRGREIKVGGGLASQYKATEWLEGQGKGKRRTRRITRKWKVGVGKARQVKGGAGKARQSQGRKQ